MEVTVAVATFGQAHWPTLAARRAIPSARALGVPVVHVHAGTLHDARNAALAQVTTEWVCFLDADDELEAGYFDAMAHGTADVRAPSVRYIHGRRAAAPGMPRVAGHNHDCTADCLPDGNWLIIGSLVRADLVRDIGGWRDFPWSEDWSVWARCWKAGATIEAIPAAVYRAHVRPRSRNRSASRSARLAAHEQIHRDVWPERYDAQLMEIVERFELKTQHRSDGCWEWTSVRNRDGYGSFWNGERLPGRNGKRGGPRMVLAHRWAYAHYVGPIPNGMCVLHECDQPWCVNPRHLRLGTQADNVADCASKGRRQQSRYRKLSPEIHEEIRARYGTPGPSRGPLPRGEGPSQRELAEEFGVAQPTISLIIRSP